MKTQYLYMSKCYHTSLCRTSNCEYEHSSLPGRFSPMLTACHMMMIMVGSHILRFGQCHMQFHIPTMWKVEGLNCGPEKLLMEASTDTAHAWTFASGRRWTARCSNPHN